VQPCTTPCTWLYQNRSKIWLGLLFLKILSSQLGSGHLTHSADRCRPWLEALSQTSGARKWQPAFLVLIVITQPRYWFVYRTCRLLLRMQRPLSALGLVVVFNTSTHLHGYTGRMFCNWPRQLSWNFFPVYYYSITAFFDDMRTSNSNFRRINIRPCRA
jgi:hypothetical protein